MCRYLSVIFFACTVFTACLCSCSLLTLLYFLCETCGSVEILILIHLMTLYQMNRLYTSNGRNFKFTSDLINVSKVVNNQGFNYVRH
jgi:hypothetical protein